MLGITAHRLTLCKPNARNRNDTFGGCQMDDCHQSFAKKLVGYHRYGSTRLRTLICGADFY